MLKRKRFTTINTDAGLKPDGRAAFAYWIRSEKITLRGAQALTADVKNSNEAELAAILNALYIVANNDYLRSANVIVVNSDNKQALQVLRDRRINGYAKYVEFYKGILAKINCPIYYKHVKGHTKGNTAREWVNNWCDKELRKHY